MDGDGDFVKMHDIIHAVAVSIASTSRLWFNLQDAAGLKEMLEKKLPKHSAALKGLPNLTQFGSRISVEFSSMTQLSIEDCPKLKTFSFSSAITSGDIKQSKQVEEINGQDDIHPLFNKKVQVRDLKFLRIDKMDNMRQIWHYQLPANSFSKMDSLGICNCHNLLNIFPSNMLGRLQKLEKLCVGSCDSLEEIIGELKISSCTVEEIVAKEEDICRIVFPQLTRLELTHLPSIKRFYPGLYISEWPKLKILRMWVCNKVKILTSEFFSLQEIREESQLEKSIQEPMFIIDKVGFGGMEKLTLSEFPHLKQVWHNQFPISFFSSLKSLVVDVDCSNLKYIFTPSVVLGLVQLQELEVKNCAIVEAIIVIEEEMIDEYTLFPNLNRLDLKHLPKLSTFCNYAGNSIELPSLAELCIENCPNMEIFVSSCKDADMPPSKKNHYTDMQPFFGEKVFFLLHIILSSPAFETFSSAALTSADINQSKLVEEMNCQDDIHPLFDQMVQVRDLKSLRIDKMDNMKQIWHYQLAANSFSKMDSLKLYDCHNLVGFGGMEKLTLSEFPFLKEVWHNQFPISFFSSLKSLVVDIDCSNLKYIFTPSVVLEVKNCAIVEAIIVIEEEMIDEYTLFPNLNRLDLKHLPKLSTFCNYAGNSIELPSLAELCIENCPNMEIFVSSCKDADMPPSKKNHYTDMQPFFGEKVFFLLHIILSSPAFETFSSAALTSADINQSKQVEEMNCQDDIHPLFDQMVRIPDLKVLGIHKMDNIRQIWHHQLAPNSFSKIDSFKVYDCHNVLNIFPSNMIGRLQKLEELSIRRCNSLEEIFGELKISSCKVEEIVGKEEGICRIVFPQLTRLELADLSSIRRFYPGLYISELPKLKKLRMWGCNQVKILTSEFLSLQEIHEESQFKKPIQEPLFIIDKVGFGGMKNLTLSEFPHLKEVWHSQFPISSFSSLKSLVVDIDCSNLKYIFTPSVALGLVQLQELEVKNSSILEAIIFIEEEMIDNALFPNLNKLDLKHLPKLSRFCNYAGNSIELPSLAKLWIDNCPNMEIFISGCKDADMPASKENLHTNIQPFFGEKFLSFLVIDVENQHEMPMGQPPLLLDKVPLTNLESLGLDWKWFEKEALHKKLPEYSCKLKFLTINGFHKGADICVFCFLHKLPNLEKLQVAEGFYKEVFLCEGLSCEEEHVEVPRKLNHLRLVDLADSLHLIQTIEAEDDGFWEGNLNTTIQHMFIENGQSSKED
ncbi:hypothetical protein JRO89_XS12G0005400 [Xanthoceras sorbifolium]|uniref:Disease resistance protein At4g27190-like leucine-rich repeats domain-containing protein n=1 Tax=Xanthoceras sorbifolium TaxID=99658 RepID=A0ABQ8HA67_9ROSI|nr:hypothetical protein JRO89_XS12G0005400 [Xanthoceras sorbifolium]